MDTEYAWAAGFLDGEGTITIKRYMRYGRIVFQPYVTCTQAEGYGHFEAIEHLKKLFGGSVSKSTPKPPRTKTLQWTVVSRSAVKCLKKVRPYLKIKHTNADILLSYYEDTNTVPTGHYRLSDEELTLRQELWEKMRLLNLRGTLRLQRLSEQTPKGEATV